MSERPTRNGQETPRQRSSARDLDNLAVAERLEAFAALLDLAGASYYTARAYRRAAELVRGLGAPVAELVRRGAAAPYLFHGDRGRYANALVLAATQAQGDRRGLWGACPGTVLDPYRQIDARP